MTLQQLILILRARWITVALVMVIAVLGAITVNWVLPKQYHSTATIVVDTKTTDPINAASNQQQPAIAGYLATQVRIVSSERVIRRVVETLKLREDASILKLYKKQVPDGQLPFDIWISALLVKSLTVRAAPDANLINIMTTWTDAALGARLVARGHARLAERSPAAFDRSIAAVVAEADERVRAGDAPLSRPASAPLR